MHPSPPISQHLYLPSFLSVPRSFCRRAVCNVTFCASSNRKRSLLASQCEGMSCAINSLGVGNCNLTRVLPQDMVFTTNATVFKSDGVRKSQPTQAPLPAFSIPLFP